MIFQESTNIVTIRAYIQRAVESLVALSFTEQQLT